MNYRALPALLLMTSLAACNGDDSVTSGDGSTTGDDETGTTTEDVTVTDTTTGQSAIEPPRYFLRIDDDPPPPVVLQMDQQKTLETFGVKAAKEITLIDLDSTAMLNTALELIQSACGENWKKESEDAGHDCPNGNYIGQALGDDWATTPEFALIRLLTMTPSNANVKGTSLEFVANYLKQNEQTLPDTLTLKNVLANSLNVYPNESFLPLSDVVETLKTTLLSSHPNVTNEEGKLSVTLYDALLDMAPLGEKLGPVDEHPGILDPSYTPSSDALTKCEPDDDDCVPFGMKVTAESNLRFVDGIDLSEGGGDMFVSIAPDVLSLDFLDESKAEIKGIADNPTVNMRIAMREAPTHIDSCTGEPCKDVLPPPADNQGTGIWTEPVWYLERIVTTSGYNKYNDRNYGVCYITDLPNCDAGVWIGPADEPNGGNIYSPPTPLGDGGWAMFYVLGKPVPEAQYVWELLLEIVQARLRDINGDGVEDIAEGDAKPAFTFENLSIGLTAEELVAEIRVNLQNQTSKISDVILGKFWRNNDHLDFYYRRAVDFGPDGGAPYLFFVDETDPRPDPNNKDELANYNYANPGFFSDPGLTDKVSSKVVSGVPDTSHEKYQLPAGETTLYMQDETDTVYEVRFFVPDVSDPVEIVAHITPL